MGDSLSYLDNLWILLNNLRFSPFLGRTFRYVKTYNSHEMNKPLRLEIRFRVPQDGVLEEGLSLAYEPVPEKSSVAPSGLCSTESE